MHYPFSLHPMLQIVFHLLKSKERRGMPLPILNFMPSLNMTGHH